MNEIVERAAIAVRKARSDFYWENAYEAPDDILALAVIRSLREPTFDQQDTALHDLGNAQPRESKQWLREYWKAMVDAALK